MRITNKIITAAVAVAMLMSTAPVMPMTAPVTAYAETTIGEKLTACTTGTELNEVLSTITSEECTELGISLDGYNSLKYPEFAAAEMIEAKYTAENFAETFNTVMDAMIYTETIDNFDIGANYNPTESVDSNIGLKSGVEIKIRTIVNGFSTSVSGSSGYVMYNEISNPYAITGVSAEITGQNEGKDKNNRGTKITGYSTVLPQYGGDAESVGAVYALNSDEFNAWTAYVADFEGVTEDVFTFAVGSTASNKVELKDTKSGLNAVKADKTPLVLRFSEGEQYQRINVLKLTLTYDNTIILQKEQDIKEAKGAELAACVQAAELDAALKALTDKEIKILGIDVNSYKTLAYPEIAAAKIIELKQEYSDFAGFKTAFESVVADMVEEIVINNFDLGANYNPTETTVGAITVYPGVEIKAAQISNGYSTSSGYVMYNEISNPYAITSISADMTGANAGAGTGGARDRETKMTGYSTELPEYKENTGKDGTEVEYSLTSDEFKAWESYVAGFKGVTEDVFKFAEGSTASNTVELDAVKAGLNAVKADKTPLVLKFSDSIRAQRINNLKLTLIYDNTIILQKEQDIKEAKGAELAACVQAAELDAALKALTDKEIDLLGINVNSYKALGYPEVAADAIVKQEYSDFAGFKTAFESVVAGMIYTETVENYDLGVMVNPTENALNVTATSPGIQPGLTFQMNYLTNGKWDASSGSYLMYEIDKPYGVKNIKAEITGTKTDRDTYISGYSTTEPPYKAVLSENKTSEKWGLDTDTYKLWASYISENFTDYKSPVYAFAESEVCENDISGSNEVSVVRDLNAIILDKTPLVLKVSQPSDGADIGNHTIMSAKLTITYDRTMIKYQQQGLYNELANDILACETAEELDDKLQSTTPYEAEVLELDVAKYQSLAHSEYAAKAILAEEYSDIDTFKAVFTDVMGAMLHTETIENYDLGANYNPTTSTDTSIKLMPGVEIKTTQITNGFSTTVEGASGYVMYNQISNPYAITSISANITGNNPGQSNSGRKTQITGYSIVLPKYRENTTSNGTAEYALDSDEFKAWESYVSSFKGVTEDVFTFAEGSTASNTVELDAVKAGLNAVKADKTPLVLEFSGAPAYQRINVLKLTIEYDETIRLYNEENGVSEVVTAVNAITNETADADVLDVINSYLPEILLDSTLTEKFNELANSVQIQIMKDLSAQKNTELSAMQSAMAALVTAAKDVEIKYAVTAFPFINYTDEQNKSVGLANEMTVKKLTNSTEDFTIVLAAYQGGVLTNVALIDKDNVPTKSDYAYNYTTLKNAKDGEEQTIYIGNFFTEFQPDAVKVLVLNSLGNLKPIAEVYEVADPKAVKTAE